MTFTHMSETINGYTVSIEQEKFSRCFTVYIYGTCDGDWYTYRKSNPQPDLKKARATYNRYRREVKAMA